MAKEITVLFQIDACRYDYISKTNAQFLNSLTSSGLHGRLIPTFGFEPDAAYVAGLYPDEANGGAQFWYDINSSPFKFLGKWSKILNYLPYYPERISRKIIEKIVSIKCKSPTLSTSRVPFHLLKYFDFPMAVRMDHDKFVNSETIFTKLVKYKKEFLYHGSPDNNVDIDSVVNRVKNNLYHPISFAFFHIGNLDRIGHKFGPSSFEMKKEIQIVDKGIEKINKILKSRFDIINYIIIGDHGMIEVNNFIDIKNELSKLPLKIENDYMYFLDSPMARFWFYSEYSKNIITECLKGIDGGHILTKIEEDRFHLNYNHNKFGDLIFMADPGYLIYPNFYQYDKIIKGMHGYLPEHKDQQSLFIINSKKIDKHLRYSSVDMRRIFPTALKLLNLPTDDDLKLKSIY